MQELVALHFEEIEENNEYKKIIEYVIKKCFEEEKLENLNLYISITLTTPEKIKLINKTYRNIDKETDVLSFPMFEKNEIDDIVKNSKKQVELDTIGDIIISIQKVKEQAEEYGHSFERELSYMVVHGFYHLMGYDHMTDSDKKVMREKEENVLNLLEIRRDGKI